MVQLTTERLLLRTTVISDDGLLAKLQQRAPVKEYIGHLTVPPSGGHFFTILHQAIAVGQVALVRSHAFDGADYEMVCVLVPEAEGCGIATEACKRVLAWAFEAIPLTRVFGLVDSRNREGERLVRRLGMKMEFFTANHEAIYVAARPTMHFEDT